MTNDETTSEILTRLAAVETVQLRLAKRQVEMAHRLGYTMGRESPKKESVMSREDEALIAVGAHVESLSARMAPTKNARHAVIQCRAFLKSVGETVDERDSGSLTCLRSDRLLQLAACAVKAVIDLRYPLPTRSNDGKAEITRGL